MEKSEIKIGIPVIYWGVIKSNGEKLLPKRSTITSEVWESPSGEEMCMIADKSGGVLISHLEHYTIGTL